ncbi:unnamed protein product, partial [Bubo scandiacus]
LISMSLFCVGAVPRPGFRFTIPLLQGHMGIICRLTLALFRMATRKIWLGGTDLQGHTELQGIQFIETYTRPIEQGQVYLADCNTLTKCYCTDNGHSSKNCARSSTSLNSYMKKRKEKKTNLKTQCYRAQV